MLSFSHKKIHEMKSRTVCVSVFVLFQIPGGKSCSTGPFYALQDHYIDGSMVHFIVYKSSKCVLHCYKCENIRKYEGNKII
jgi:hypothetical protein